VRNSLVSVCRASWRASRLDTRTADDDKGQLPRAACRVRVRRARWSDATSDPKRVSVFSPVHACPGALAEVRMRQTRCDDQIIETGSPISQ
jgi:hypothetical protein